MQLSQSLKQFLRQPLMIVIGTAGTTLRPAIARGAGVFIAEQEGHVDVVFSGWQWPDTAANIRETGRMALTVVSPCDYVSYQMKGRAWLGAPTADTIARSDAYLIEVAAELFDLGVDGRIAAPWLTNREPVLATLNISEIYVQTPGPKAGMAAGPAA